MDQAQRGPITACSFLMEPLSFPTSSSPARGSGASEPRGEAMNEKLAIHTAPVGTSRAVLCQTWGTGNTLCRAADVAINTIFGI